MVTFSTLRLGKKKMEPKEKEVKSVEGISRLICLSKGHNAPLKVHIDGSEWAGVKFFQLSSSEEGDSVIATDFRGLQVMNAD